MSNCLTRCMRTAVIASRIVCPSSLRNIRWSDAARDGQVLEHVVDADTRNKRVRG